MKIPDMIPVTDLRQDAAAVIKRLRKSRDPLVVTQRGRAIAVLQSIEDYQEAERERELLRLLARGEREITAGKGYSLDSVLKEADDLLGEGNE
ncbi:MAG: type II toxin-antitoxin system Phd/YefM family antitoxin [Deltaproteobacteria bacterium]|nr:MAG: type II toxin-antitoxin system Phd/YefM family antitoxin [Deltaproteobacteria bacterium]